MASHVALHRYRKPMDIANSRLSALPSSSHPSLTHGLTPKLFHRIIDVIFFN